MSDEHLKKAAIKGAKWNTIATALTTILSIFRTAFLARILSEADFGFMGIVMVVIGFAQIFMDMGISQAVIHHQENDAKILSSLYWLNLIAGFILFVLLLVLNPLIITFYQKPELEPLIQISSFNFLIIPLGQLYQQLLQKDLEFKKLALSEIVSAIVGTIVGITLGIINQDVYSLVWAQISISGTKSIMLFFMGMGKWTPRFYFSGKDLKGYLSFGLFQLGDRTLNYIATNIDKMILGRFLDPTNYGYYQLAYNLIIYPFQLINPIITKISFPIFAKIQNEKSKLKEYYFVVINLISTITFPIFIFMNINAESIILIFYGEKWLPSIIYFRIFSFLGMVFSIGNPVGSLLLAKGYANRGFYWNLLQSIIQIPLISVFAYYFDAQIVASVFLLFRIVAFYFAYLLMIQPVLGKCFKEYSKAFLNQFYFSLGMGLVMFLIMQFLVISNPFLNIIVFGIIGGSTYLFEIYIFNPKLIYLVIVNIKLDKWKLIQNLKFYKKFSEEELDQSFSNQEM